MKKIFLLATIMAAAIFSGCSKDEGTTPFKYDETLLYGTWNITYMEVPVDPENPKGETALLPTADDQKATLTFTEGHRITGVGLIAVKGAWKTYGDYIIVEEDGVEAFKIKVLELSSGAATMSLHNLNNISMFKCVKE